MNKKSIIYLFIITITLIVIFEIFNRWSIKFVDSSVYETESLTINTTETIEYDYNLDEAPENYGVRKSKEDRTRYYEFLKQNIRPVKLLNFITENDMETSFYDVSGNTMVDWLVYKAYGHLFQSMFSSRKDSFDDYPVTNNFLQKFNTNLTNFFDLKYDEIWVDVWDEDKIIKVEVRRGIALDGESEYAMLYRFKYILDEEGNVDDVILEHIGWD